MQTQDDKSSERNLRYDNSMHVYRDTKDIVISQVSVLNKDADLLLPHDTRAGTLVQKNETHRL